VTAANSPALPPPYGGNPQQWAEEIDDFLRLQLGQLLYRFQNDEVDITQLETDVANLQSSVSTLQSDLSALTTRFNALGYGYLDPT
jgi:uncharacterized coiled-coil protein SlyX